MSFDKAGPKMAAFSRPPKLTLLTLLLLAVWYITVTSTPRQPTGLVYDHSQPPPPSPPEPSSGLSPATTPEPSLEFPPESALEFAPGFPPESSPELPPFPPAAIEEEQWAFNPARDRNNYSLSEQQCSTAFPDLYVEIDRAAVFWQERNENMRISQDQLDLDWSYDGGMRCMIYNQQLYVVYSRGVNHFQHWKERSHATLFQIHRAILSSPQPIPNIEFSVKINDVVSLTDSDSDAVIWAFSRNMSDTIMDQVWLMPDFNYWSYPGVVGSFAHYQSQVIDAYEDFDSKQSQLVWRGTPSFNPAIRESLLEQSRDKEWSNVHNVSEDADDEDAAQWKISLPDHCQYKFAVHTEGTTWSGRLKYLLSCHSVVLIHTLSWTTHLYHLLESSGMYQNYQWVHDGWSNLDQVMEDLLNDDDKARRIADNAAFTFRDRYMTPAAQTCYWRRLFKTWSDVAFEPDPWRYENHDDGRVEKFWRGVAFEEYIFSEGDLLE